LFELLNKNSQVAIDDKLSAHKQAVDVCATKLETDIQSAN